MRHVDLILRVWRLLSLCHAVRQVGDLVVSGATSRHDKRRLTSEVALAASALSANGRINSPLMVFRVLDRNLLRGRLAHNRVEVELLGIRAFMSDALTHHSQLDRFTTSHSADNLLSDARVSQ